MEAVDISDDFPVPQRQRRVGKNAQIVAVAVVILVANMGNSPWHLNTHVAAKRELIEASKTPTKLLFELTVAGLDQFWAALAS